MDTNFNKNMNNLNMTRIEVLMCLGKLIAFACTSIGLELCLDYSGGVKTLENIQKHFASSDRPGWGFERLKGGGEKYKPRGAQGRVGGWGVGRCG